MSYTLLDAAYAMYYPKAEFAKNPFRKKKKPGLLRRTGRAARKAAGSAVGKTWAGRGVRAAGVLAGAGLLKRQTTKARAGGLDTGRREGENVGYGKGYNAAMNIQPPPWVSRN